jgi:L-alanine-DL-glutamate epimerase-like enolase superfamily enzyme
VRYLQKLVQQSGAKALKFRIGGRMSRNADAMPGRTETLIPLVRKTFGDQMDIHADSNSSYDPPKAIEVGRMLEGIKAVYYEEPCPFDHLEDTKKVADTLTIPVAGGEQEYSDWRFRWMIANRGVDIVQPDLLYYGGMVRSIRVAHMADAANMPTTVHISGEFGFVYMLHFASCVRDAGRYQEYKLGTENYGNWFDPPISVKNGKMSVPSGPVLASRTSKVSCRAPSRRPESGARARQAITRAEVLFLHAANAWRMRCTPCGSACSICGVICSSACG